MWQKYNFSEFILTVMEAQFVITILAFPLGIQLVNSENVNNGADRKTNNATGNLCNIDMKECLAKVPTMKEEANIPTTPKEVENACRTFDIGMECVEEYSKQCLTIKKRQQLKASMKGAHDIFAFLCKDQKFRAEFLSHSTCYKKISRRWDECAEHFIESLKKADQRGSLSVCCIRLRYLQCVAELTHLHCSRNAELFLQKVAETLATSNTNKTVAECPYVTTANCSETSGACSSLKPSSFPVLFANRMLTSFIRLSEVIKNFGEIKELLSFDGIRSWLGRGVTMFSGYIFG